LKELRAAESAVSAALRAVGLAVWTDVSAARSRWAAPSSTRFLPPSLTGVSSGLGPARLVRRQDRLPRGCIRVRHTRTMKTRTLGQGLAVSEQGLGCMGMSAWYGTTDEAESIATIHRAL